jgi:hypothetical protein
MKYINKILGPLFLILSVAKCGAMENMQLFELFPRDVWNQVLKNVPANNLFLNQVARTIELDAQSYENIMWAFFGFYCWRKDFPLEQEVPRFINRFFKTVRTKQIALKYETAFKKTFAMFALTKSCTRQGIEDLDWAIRKAEYDNPHGDRRIAYRYGIKLIRAYQGISLSRLFEFASSTVKAMFPTKLKPYSDVFLSFCLMVIVGQSVLALDNYLFGTFFSTYVLAFFPFWLLGILYSCVPSTLSALLSLAGLGDSSGAVLIDFLRTRMAVGGHLVIPYLFGLFLYNFIRWYEVDFEAPYHLPVPDLWIFRKLYSEPLLNRREEKYRNCLREIEDEMRDR